jgi:hypothetical protein
MIDYTDENLGMYADIYEDRFGEKINQASVDYFLSLTREEQSAVFERLAAE